MTDRAISRLQWSKRGITGYDEHGSFAFRLEHPADVDFMNRLIMGGLAKIREQIQERAAFKKDAAEVEGAPV